jgi:tetratricopeptide (TPR) repeat protein
MNTSTPEHSVPSGRRHRLWRWLLVTALIVGAGVAVWAVTVEVALWRGAACLEAREHERAFAWLRFAARVSGERGELHYLLARCYRRLSRFAEVSVHLRRAQELGWDVSQLEREQWLALAQTGQFEAVNPHWAVLFEHPGSDGPELSKAFVTGCLGWFRVADARRVLEAWEADYPRDPEPHFQRGRLAETALDWAGAVQAYRRALELAPQRTDARLGLANALVKVGELQAADAEFRRVVEADPSNVPARVAVAQSAGKLGQPNEAKRLLHEILQTQPNYVDALLELGNLELRTGQVPEAQVHLRQAAELKPESREVLYAYGKALQAAGQTAAANQCFKFVDEATKPLAQLKKLLDRLLQDPENRDVRFQIASITWKYKSRDEGEKWFRSLLRINPQHQPTHAALAIHYKLLGNEERAAYHRGLSGGLEGIKKVVKVEPGEGREGEAANGSVGAAPSAVGDDRPDEERSRAPQPEAAQERGKE